MRKIFKRKKVLASQEAAPDIAREMGRIQQQLVSLEKKVDSLISQSSGGPSERHSRGRNFSRPFRSFDRSRGRGRGRQESGPGVRSLTQVICAECGKDCEVPFRPSADRPVYCRECFAKRKGGGSFRGKRDNNFGDENRKFSHGRKPSFLRRSK